MINYLPPDQRKQLHAARTNVLLVRYNIGLLLATAFLGVAVFAVSLLLSSEKRTAENTVASNQARVGNFSSVQARADEFRKDLSDAKGLLDNEILYSKVYTEIARIMPAGTVLESLKLNATQFGTPMTLPVKIKGEKQAGDLLNAFKGSVLFGHAASYGTLTANSGKDSAEYPYIITINVTLDKGAIL